MTARVRLKRSIRCGRRYWLEFWKMNSVDITCVYSDNVLSILRVSAMALFHQWMKFEVGMQWYLFVPGSRRPYTKCPTTCFSVTWNCLSCVQWLASWYFGKLKEQTMLAKQSFGCRFSRTYCCYLHLRIEPPEYPSSLLNWFVSALFVEGTSQDKEEHKWMRPGSLRPPGRPSM